MSSALTGTSDPAMLENNLCILLYEKGKNEDEFLGKLVQSSLSRMSRQTRANHETLRSNPKTKEKTG